MLTSVIDRTAITFLSNFCRRLSHSSKTFLASKSAVAALSLLTLFPTLFFVTHQSAMATAATRLQLAPESHLLAASYYTLANGYSTYLTLNNKGAAELTVSTAVYSLVGVRLDLAPIVVQPDSFRVVDLSTLSLPAAFQQGSLQVTYFGDPLQLGAHLRVGHASYSLLFDEQLTDRAHGVESSRLDGVWWLPEAGCTVKVVISNAVSSPLSGTVKATAPSGATVTTPLVLGAHETKLLDLSLNLLGGATPATSGGITVQHNGAAGAAMARILVQKPSIGYSAAMEMVDTATARSTYLNGAGLRFRSVAGQELRSALVLRNVGSVSTTVTGKVQFTKLNGTQGTKDLSPRLLLAGEVHTVLTSTLLTAQEKESVQVAGIELAYTGAPGSIVAALQTVSLNGTHSFRVPLLDSDALPSSTGGYPWYIEGGSSTFVYIRNVSPVARYYKVRIDYGSAEEAVFHLGVRSLLPGETLVLDVKALRDNQTPDEEGRVIPLAETHGQVYWSQDNSNELALIGRAEQTNVSAGVSSSYACVNCCEDSFVAAKITGPEVATAGPVEFKAKQRDFSCYSVDLSYHRVPFYIPVNWNSSNPAVVEFIEGQGGHALVKNVTQPTTVTISATWPVIEYRPLHAPDCREAPESPSIIPGLESCCLVVPLSADPSQITITVLPLSVDKLVAIVPGTPNVAAPAPVPNIPYESVETSLDYGFAAGQYMTVPYGTPAFTIFADNVQPANVSGLPLKWDVTRNPADSLAGPVGLYPIGTSTAIFDPTSAGSFRIVYYHDANGDNEVEQGEVLRILKIAVVKFSLVAEGQGAIDPLEVGGLNTFGGYIEDGTVHLNTDTAMLARLEVLLEGGGSNRQIGTSSIQLGGLGNLTFNDFQVNYAPDGYAREVKYGDYRFCDCSLGAGVPPNGGDDPFRSTSRDSERVLKPFGMSVVVEADDEPDVVWPLTHPYTSGTFTSTQGGLSFTEYFAAYSSDFKQSYVLVGDQGWYVIYSSTYVGGSFVYQASTVNKLGFVSRVSFVGDGQPATESNVQVRGTCAREFANLPLVFHPQQ